MDADKNLQEQEKLLTLLRRPRSDRAALRAELAELREALWTWLNRHGYEPRWLQCPNAARHYRSYGGSNAPELIKGR